MHTKLVSQGMQTAHWTLALVLLLLLCCAAVLPAHSAVRDLNKTPDTASASAPQLPKAAAAPDQARECLLRTFNSTTAHTRERKVFSQYGEDGIIESIFGCIGTTDRYFVEFGVEDGTQCTTRNLRENHGFSGLMMDGGNSRPEINLQQEMMFSHNIVQLFKKHKVPHPGFDHLTVDLDQNTFWVALAVLRGGYRPRSLTVEINRNLAWRDSYATIDMPEEMAFTVDACESGCNRAPGIGDCYFGASIRAWAVMLRSFGYHLVASDVVGVNAFFVHESAVGKEPLLSLADAQRVSTNGGEYPAIHGQCIRHAWVRIDDGVDFSDPSLDVGNLPWVFLGYKPGGDHNKQRVFYEAKVPAGLQERFSSGVGKKGSGTSEKLAELSASATAAVKQQAPKLKEGLAVGASVAGWVATLQVWSFAVLVAAAFVCGVLLQRFGSRLVHAGTVALRGSKYTSL